MSHSMKKKKKKRKKTIAIVAYESNKSGDQHKSLFSTIPAVGIYKISRV